MGKVILYIATSLDGFIARIDGSLDWLYAIPNPANEDHGYNNLLKSIDTIIMGRKTYDEIIGFGVEWPYSEYNTYIATNKDKIEITTSNTFILNTNIKKFIEDRKKQSEKDIWLVGGGELITYFLNNGLIDTMILSIIPIILGEGIILFPNCPKETKWILKESKQFTTGIVNLTYDLKPTEK